ncbi:hypothetical protein X739_00760 [Mesorhizobium sp. LNHC220B00]|nr:Lar family restriction alleviation protein [Mesorhizobium sp. LNHC220B00]ESY89056.1 hypothetical protein X739_00760 [Mesorhizobium sp. LNHC220B00]
MADTSIKEPCPFCRTRDTSAERWRDHTGEHHRVVCHNCGATGPEKDTRGEAVDGWNRRNGGDGHA